MENPDKKTGCAPILRRNFLFFIVMAIATVYKDFFIQIFQVSLPRAIATLEAIQSLKSPNPETLPQEKLPQNPPLPKQPAIANSPPKTVTSEVKVQKNKPIQVRYQTLNNINYYQATIDLNQPENLITIALANNAEQANNSRFTNGDEKFENMVYRYPAAVVASGTFFSLDYQKRVMGNMVAGGKFLKYRPWENYGTTLGLRVGNQPEMITARIEGKPQWQEHWFSLTGGPRLLKNGKIWLAPKSEGFKDPNVLNVAYRTAIGFSTKKKLLFLVTFLAPLSLEDEAKMMRAIGCDEAMNLDGGPSVGLASQGKVLISPQRPLTNAIVVYDRFFPAPKALKTSWQRFQKGDRPQIPK